MKLCLFLLLIWSCSISEAGVFRRRRAQDRVPHRQPSVVLPPATVPSTTPATSSESQIIAETNAYRARHGLRALTADSRLSGLSNSHSAWMARNRSMTHSRHGVAENIAMGQRTVSQAVQAWYNSPGHRANMLNPNHVRMGASVHVSSSGTLFWCQQFSR